MTENQKQLLNDLLLDFPEAKRYLEYEDYTANPTVENASELISTIIERNADVIGNRQNFVGYMAMRPGVQKRGSHGLFNEKDEPIILDRVANEIANHKGNVWSHVISLRREDAIRLGYDNSEAWRQLVMRHISDIAKNQKISLCNLKWYAAFHDTTHHPHIHLLVYSENTKEGFLTNEGINKIRSAFANDIFHDDLQSIYQEQTLSRDELKAVSKTEFESVVRKIQQSDFENPQLENLIRKLYSQLQNVKGKKVYGYLPQEVKETVNSIFSELANDDNIRQLYEKYGTRLKINLMSVYPEEDKEQIPWDFIRIVSCKPEQLLFIAFPLAVLYKVFHFLPPVKSLLLKNKILRAYYETDAVLDEAGISFVDSRGFVMNTYGFVCAAVPMLMGTPVLKYSQAMGTFHSFWNRFLAKWILPKMRLICARGKGTLDNLKGIGIEKNVKLCADGAFTMADDPYYLKQVEAEAQKDAFFNDKVVGLSISSVVRKKCDKLGIDYPKIMTDFIDRLNEDGWNVLIIANGARIHSDKPRNNDLPVCDVVYESVKNKEMVRWYHKEMTAEEIRAYIGLFGFVVASRFHAMIGALQQKVPVLLVGWSHKYQEVLDFFELGQYAIDFSDLTAESLQKEFEKFIQEEETIRGKLDEHYEEVMESSKKNIVYVSEIVDEIVGE